LRPAVLTGHYGIERHEHVKSEGAKASAGKTYLASNHARMFIRSSVAGAGGEPNAAAMQSNLTRASSYALVPVAA